MEKRELDAPNPDLVMYTKRSAEFQDLVFELVDSGRDDRDAVQELVRVAGSHRTELRRAAASIRQEGYVEEDEARNRANRLLMAAASGEPPQPLNDEQTRWFRDVKELRDAPVHEAFAKLATVEPALGALDEYVSREANEPEFQAMDLDDRHQVVIEVLYDRLQPIQERTTEPLVRTHLAWYIVRDYLFDRAGLPYPE
jgi:hypothetical protein